MSPGLDAYWARYDATLKRIAAEQPATLEALKAILDSFLPPSSGTAFFPDGADDTLADALTAAGWDLHYQAAYLWDARSPDGVWIHYVEGDVYPGRWRSG